MRRSTKTLVIILNVTSVQNACPFNEVVRILENSVVFKSRGIALPDVTATHGSYLLNIQVRSEVLIGRAWLYQRIQKSLAAGSKLVMLKGGSSTGKTTICRHLVAHTKGESN